MLGQTKLARAPSWIGAEDGGLKRDQANKPIVSEVIEEGQRNATLLSLAGRMRHRNLPVAEIRNKLLAANRQQCSPPLDAKEVGDIVRSVMRYEPSSLDVVRMTLNDAGNADRLVEEIALDVRYVSELDMFIEWTGSSWRRSDFASVVEKAKVVLRRISDEADICQDETIRKALRSHASNSLNRSRLMAACELAKTDLRLRVPHRRLDSKPFLLPVANGVIDLKAGKLIKGKRQDFMTRASPVAYDPAATCPQFKRFLFDVVGKDKRYAEYVCRLMGYLLTGMTTEQKFYFAHGVGANGKSTLFAVIRELLGPDLVSALPADSLMLKIRGRGATNDLARLDGVRVVLSNEIQEGSQFDEPLLKALTGGDVVTARFLYREFVDYVPKFKLLIAGNHLPLIKGDDIGIWRRVEYLPFTVQIAPEDRDPKLLDKLKRELPGILALAVRGCTRWVKDGLQQPDVIKTASAMYRSEMDTLGRWFADCGEVGDGNKWYAGDAYASYQEWSGRNGLNPMSGTAFGRRIKARYRHKRSKQGVVYLGVGPVQA